jgi:hypothetical protein
VERGTRPSTRISNSQRIVNELESLAKIWRKLELGGVLPIVLANLPEGKGNAAAKSDHPSARQTLS